EGRKYDFRLEAFVGEQLIGKACHTRVRVNSKHFMAKVAE
ncbi:TPA: diaminopimelate epimerase, partial [Streptococcus pyogenes]|nr:diaminopimelate epimerase [Streptococcus pyogenes]